MKTKKEIVNEEKQSLNRMSPERLADILIRLAQCDIKIGSRRGHLIASPYRLSFHMPQIFTRNLSVWKSLQTLSIQPPAGDWRACLWSRLAQKKRRQSQETPSFKVEKSIVLNDSSRQPCENSTHSLMQEREPFLS
jgi:hypothetical protein